MCAPADVTNNTLQIYSYSDLCLVLKVSHKNTKLHQKPCTSYYCF